MTALHFSFNSVVTLLVHFVVFLSLFVCFLLTFVLSYVPCLNYPCLANALSKHNLPLANQPNTLTKRTKPVRYENFRRVIKEPPRANFNLKYATTKDDLSKRQRDSRGSFTEKVQASLRHAGGGSSRMSPSVTLFLIQTL